jgi:hypothetical protein
VVIPDAPPRSILTAPDVLGPYGRAIPILIAFGLLVGGIALFRRDEPWFAERV